MPKAFFIIRHKGFDVPSQFFNCGDTVADRGNDLNTRVIFILDCKTLFSYHLEYEMLRIVFNLRLSKNNCNLKIIFTLSSFTIHDVSACMIVQHDNLGFFSFSSYYVFLTITLWQVDYGDVICNKSVWERKPNSMLGKWKYVGHTNRQVQTLQCNLVYIYTFGHVTRTLHN